MTEQEISQIEFERFKKELISVLQQMKREDSVLIVIDNVGDKYLCENCGKMHGGVRTMSKGGPTFLLNSSDLLRQKALEITLGIDDNQWGKPKEN